MEECVMTPGIMRMLLLFVINLDSHVMVSFIATA